jgi:hypothetical protein
MARELWSDVEVEMLTHAFKQGGPRLAAEVCGRSYNACATKAGELGLKRSKRRKCGLCGVTARTKPLWGSWVSQTKCKTCYRLERKDVVW